MKSIGAKVLLRARHEKASCDRERFVELVRFVEDSLNTERKLRKADARKKISSIKVEKQASLLAEFYAQDIFQIETDFPRIQRYALFVSLMSMVEANIIGLCRTARRLFPISENFNIKRTGVFERGMKYLENEGGIELSQFKDRIAQSQNLNRIRNCIVHAEGSLKNRKDKETIKDFIKATTELNIDKNERIVLKRGFVEICTQEMYIFFDCLDDSLGKKFNTKQITPVL